MEELSLKTPSKAELIEVIHTVATRGKGVHGDPIRNVDQYWSKDGKLLAEKDIIDNLEENRGKVKEQKQKPPTQETSTARRK